MDPVGSVEGRSSALVCCRLSGQQNWDVTALQPPAPVTFLSVTTPARGRVQRTFPAPEFQGEGGQGRNSGFSSGFGKHFLVVPQRWASGLCHATRRLRSLLGSPGRRGTWCSRVDSSQRFFSSKYRVCLLVKRGGEAAFEGLL